MSLQILPYDPALHGAGVAALFNRLRYAAAASGVPLDARSLNAVLDERGTTIFLVAVQENTVVGTIGFFAVSGRRVAPAGELFCGMFLIDPAHRTGPLAGRLFLESFERIVEMGIRTLRLEVDPVNVRAFPLYLRVGFRAPEGTEPDENGYLELISHLPGVVIDLLADLGEDPRGGDSGFHWRTMERARSGTLHDGVTREGGEDIVEYVFNVDDGRIRVRVDLASGSPRGTLVNEEPWVRPAAREPGETGTLPRRVVSAAVGDFLVSVDEAGTLRVEHPQHLGPLLTEHFPVSPVRRYGARRPERLRVTTLLTASGWHSSVPARDDSPAVSRELTVDEDGLRLSVDAGAGNRVAVVPWNGMRRAYVEHCGVRGTEVHAVARGHWPAEVMGYEAALESEPARGATTTWIEPRLGLEVGITWYTDGELRFEGGSLPLNISPGGRVDYRISLRSVGAAEPLPPIYTQERAEAPVWTPHRRGRAEVHEAAGHGEGEALWVVPELGVVNWETGGRRVLASSFPAPRSIGAVPDGRAGLWVSVQGPREHPEQGVEWGVGRRLPPLDIADTGPDEGWSLTRIGPDLTRLRLDVRVPPSRSDRELAVHIAPAGAGTVRLGGSPGEPEQVFSREGAHPWRATARAARFDDASGHTLQLRSVADETDEILVRAHPKWVLASLVHRVPRGQPGLASWILDAAPHPELNPLSFPQ